MLEMASKRTVFFKVSRGSMPFYLHRSFYKNNLGMIFYLTAAWLAQLGERRTAVREVESSIPAGPTLRVLKLTEKNMLPFSTSRNG